MALYTVAFSADASTYICDIVKPRGTDVWLANAGVTGTFGSGTVAFQVSIDGGTTKATLTQDGTATAASVATANGVINLQFAGMSNNNQPIELYGTLTGSTNPTLTAFVIDNR